MTARPDPQVEALIGGLQLDGPPPAPAELRSAFDAWIRELDAGRPQTAVALVADDTAASVPTRTYDPTGDATEPLDTIVFLHGGGWAAGDLDTADSGARELAAGLGVRVVSVDYRLAPEAPFPAALGDCRAVLDDVAVRASTRSLVVAGESAGGNLTAALALECRDAGVELAGQILINPLLDASSDSGSYTRYGTGYGLTTRDVQRYVGWYAGTADRSDPRLAPLAATSLAGVAPCVLSTAGFDPLLDDGIRYAKRRIEEASPSATCRCRRCCTAGGHCCMRAPRCASSSPCCCARRGRCSPEA